MENLRGRGCLDSMTYYTLMVLRDMLCVHKKSLATGESYPTAQGAGTIRPARLVFLKYTDGGRYCQGVRARSVIIGI